MRCASSCSLYSCCSLWSRDSLILSSSNSASRINIYFLDLCSRSLKACYCCFSRFLLSAKSCCLCCSDYAKASFKANFSFSKSESLNFYLNSRSSFFAWSSCIWAISLFLSSSRASSLRLYSFSSFSLREYTYWLSTELRSLPWLIWKA